MDLVHKESGFPVNPMSPLKKKKLLLSPPFMYMPFPHLQQIKQVQDSSGDSYFYFSVWYSPIIYQCLEVKTSVLSFNTDFDQVNYHKIEKWDSHLKAKIHIWANDQYQFAFWPTTFFTLMYRAYPQLTHKQWVGNADYVL